MHTKILKKCILKPLKNVYNENYRSPERVGKSAKRHFTDLSLACVCLDLIKDKLINNLKTFPDWDDIQLLL